MRPTLERKKTTPASATPDDDEEELLTLAQAGRSLPGKGVSASCCFRWATKGCRVGDEVVRLRVTRFGRRLYVSRRELKKFGRRLGDAHVAVRPIVTATRDSYAD